MTDKSVTGGTVSIEDGLKAKEEYAPARKVRVDLNFAVPEGEAAQAYLDAAADMAHRKVHELVHQKKPAAAPVTPTAAPPAASTTAAPSAPAKPEKPTAAAKKKGETPEPGSKAALEAAALAEAAKKPADAAPAVEEDPLADLLGDAAPTPVTDKELSAAAIAKAEKMKSVAGWEPGKIRKLVEEFAGKPGSKFHEIPAEKRHDFLAKLDALK